MKLISEISGLNFQVIQKAVVEFLAKGSSIDGLNIREYQIKLFDKSNSLIVIFEKLGVSPGFRGSPKGFSGFEVEIDASSSEIKNSNFVR